MGVPERRTQIIVAPVGSSWSPPPSAISCYMLTQMLAAHPHLLCGLPRHHLIALEKLGKGGHHYRNQHRGCHYHCCPHRRPQSPRQRSTRHGTQVPLVVTVTVLVSLLVVRVVSVLVLIMSVIKRPGRHSRGL